MKLLLSLLVIFAVMASTASASNDGVKCDLCQIIVKRAEVMILKNETQQHIINSMEKACAMLPSKWSRPCVALVDFYGPLIIQKIVERENPKVVCQQLRICKVGQCEESGLEIEEMIEDQIEEEFSWFDEDFEEEQMDFELEDEDFETVENLQKWKPHIPGKNIIKKYKCKACSFLVKKAEHLVKVNKTAKEIQHHLESSFVSNELVSVSDLDTMYNSHLILLVNI
ncbi:hypothetical protein PPL_02000 [Heterostelium album PN500]|uniref:Pulmonary surfactant-associated protein B n=1 Tax=Heterostelium pallidum (strain ATCC 26659 / Pp 5 / PN500) TaxID=670386 RepID=D3B132_HETP5|nr:hypothetical protein PPL_02000 [Heterostelium album PN500]EFA85006.1 hypothetical protein PPL_02000 [Heterostelium album PN500]|eukprot:XP_020437116.1 hypothetical protein PPL_02000 [Heterostelium album PN500]